MHRHNLPADQLEAIVFQKDPCRRDLLDLRHSKASPWQPLGRGRRCRLSFRAVHAYHTVIAPAWARRQQLREYTNAERPTKLFSHDMHRVPVSAETPLRSAT